MTLDEAIKHCTEVSNRTDTCADCRAEHMQLANWLRELKEKRSENAVDVVRCRDCWCHKPGKYRFDICSQTEDDFYCARGEKK